MSDNIFNKRTFTSNSISGSYKLDKYNSGKFFTEFNYANHKNHMPNINGFINKLLLNFYVTPITFNNNEGHIFSDNTQRSFSPNQYNNPNWLLHKNDHQNDLRYTHDPFLLVE